MKKNWPKSRAVLTICAALGWWSFLYPELTLTPETVLIYETDSQGLKKVPSDTQIYHRDFYRTLLSTKWEDISFRSKLLEDLSLFWEAIQNGME